MVDSAKALTSSKRKSPTSVTTRETRGRKKRSKDDRSAIGNDKGNQHSDAETLSDVSPPPSSEIHSLQNNTPPKDTSAVIENNRSKEVDEQWEVLDKEQTSIDNTAGKEEDPGTANDESSKKLEPARNVRRYPLGGHTRGGMTAAKGADMAHSLSSVEREPGEHSHGEEEIVKKGLLEKTVGKEKGTAELDQSEETVPDIEGSPSWNSIEDELEEESTVDKEVKNMRAKLRTTIEANGRLPELIALTSTGPNSAVMPVPLFNVRPEISDVGTIRRIFNISGADGTSVLHNIATANPDNYESSGNYIHVKNGSVADFFLVGSVTLSALSGGQTDKNRQICSRMLWETFPKAVAFIGKVLGKKSLYVQSFKAGVSFSTMMPRNESYRGNQSGGHYPKFAAPSPSQTGSSYLAAVQPALPSGVDVPIFDGRNSRFRLGYFEEQLKPFTGEVPEDSFVLIVFTAGTFPLPEHRRPSSAVVSITESLSLNVKSVVVLADAEQEYSGAALPDEAFWGVVPHTSPAPPTLESLGDAL